MEHPVLRLRRRAFDLIAIWPFTRNRQHAVSEFRVSAERHAACQYPVVEQPAIVFDMDKSGAGFRQIRVLAVGDRFRRLRHWSGRSGYWPREGGWRAGYWCGRSRSSAWIRLDHADAWPAGRR